VAWREFDGEGGYTYFAYQDNETWRDEYIERNGEKYANWVEPLYTASSTSHLHLLSDEFIYKVVRSSQPHLDDDCADWRRHFAECKYWLEIAHGIITPPAQPAPVQEPVAWGKLTDEMIQAATDEYDEWAADNKGTTECIRAMLVKALKATPPAAHRQWVGLTDEEIEIQVSYNCTLEDMVRSVEAKLREKNT
jgi:hypothetical protein